MAKETGIAWARSTRNLWVGCTKVGPGCDGCYAEAFQRWVRGKDEETGQAKNWGPGHPRDPGLEGAAKDLRKWNAAAHLEATTNRVNRWHDHLRPGFWPVFLNTQSDWFDNEVPQAWRDFGYELIEECTALTFYLVTKRIGNVAKMVPERWMREGFPGHVRLLITVVNQEEADRDVWKLLALPCKNGISYEPALGPIDFEPFIQYPPGHDDYKMTFGHAEWRGIEWIITGGESDQAGHKARPFDLAWARSTVAQCKAAGVPVFVKQLGSAPFDSGARVIGDNMTIRGEPTEKDLDVLAASLDAMGRIRGVIHDRAGADPSEWPEDLRVRQWPE